MYSELKAYIKDCINEFDIIPDERKKVLSQITAYVNENLNSDIPIQFTFICTHNSRRSHISQIWAQVAAAFYGIGNVQTYSGGTEATAFNQRAVAALERTGLIIDQTTLANNPIYHVKYDDKAFSVTAFSKVYNQAPNPTENYCAVMTCSHADDACPIVTGAACRIPILYEDPKVADNTPQETLKYTERCHQICREMLYAFSLVK